ncbi:MULTISPECIES: glycosyltransferase family 2 protein [Flavobacterium]|uniref:glycosyltransferase family 2 protein n=1 Tax=Flavobacterium TaxID=237 RepID=UPI001FCC23CA|nr:MULTISPECIES: glycosyltransferase family A protein [Flavobacterium]UOK41251.1 glycosyltransferase family 2 protein [Flavobacterium enshiense]
MPFFSVIIPLYNKENYIRNTLKCVLEQSFSDFEIIIVNDGSTDNGLEIVKEFTDSRIVILEQTNKGVSAARNTGIEEASGTLIALLDADDYWFPNHLEVLHKLYSDFPDAGMYCSRYKIKFAENNLYTPKLNGISENFRGIVPDFFHSSYVDRIAWTSIVAIPKEILKTIGGFNTEVSNGQDLDLWIRIAVKFPAAISDGITAHYHYEISDSLAKRSILNKKLMDFGQFSEDEKKNPSLKKFLDIYRIEYALHYHMFGNDDKMTFYLKNIDTENLAYKTKFLFLLPGSVLRTLLKVKRWLNEIGINFTVYH